jgi:hypothetical protein
LPEGAVTGRCRRDRANGLFRRANTGDVLEPVRKSEAITVNERNIPAGWAARMRRWSTPRGAVADEAEGFLQGHALEQLRMPRTRRRPAWLWLNAVIHGSLFSVLRVARNDDEADRFPDAAWTEARARLARELVEVSANDEARMRELQRRALIPLELRLDDLAELPPARLVDVAINELHLACR